MWILKLKKKKKERKLKKKNNNNNKNGNSKFLMSETVKTWEFPFFVLKMIKNFGYSHVFFTLATKNPKNA